MTHAYWLVTERLALRRFTRDDLDWLTTLRSDPEVMRYAGGPRDRADSEELLNIRMLGYYEAYPGLGNWLTVERATGEAVGLHLLNHIRGESIVQVGFFLAKSFWGRGYAAEMGRALLRHGFETMSLSSIAGIATLDNGASQRVLTKIGLERHGERAFPHPVYADAGPMAWFERSRDDWLAADSRP